MAELGMQTGVNPLVREMVQKALDEDLSQGDMTTDNLPVLADMNCTLSLRVREACVVSGMTVASLAFHLVDESISVEPLVSDGQTVEAGARLAWVSGSMASVLKAERTALNFLQHLCGVATATNRFVSAIVGTNTRITHTRKTTPGLRLLEQQAVLHGGGLPHRYNLGSCVMLKDNHLQALGVSGMQRPIAESVHVLRQRLSHTVKIEVEADTLAQVEEAVEAGADIILLDNMTPGQIRQALAIIAGRAITEASGGIGLQNVRDYAETGVDCISTSKITLGVQAIDIGLDVD